MASPGSRRGWKNKAPRARVPGGRDVEGSLRLLAKGAPLKKTLVVIAVIFASMIIGLAIAPFFIDEPLRRYAERRLNESLPGFTATIGKLRTRPLALSLDLDSVVIVQQAHPDRPVIELPRVQGGLSWLSLLTLHVVADARVDDPRLNINMENLGPVLEKMKQAPPSAIAWQDKLVELPPFRVSEFRVTKGSLLYTAEGAADRLSIEGIAVVVRNMKNEHAPPGELPTGLFLEALLPGSGRVRLDGSADLLQKPLLSIKADASLQRLDLAAFKDLARPLHIFITKGIVEGSMRIEHTPGRKVFILKELTLTEPVIDYHSYAAPLPEEAKKEQKAESAAKAKELQKELVDKPGLVILANRVRIQGGTLGLVNKSAKPDYRVFMDRLDLEVRNFSNHFSEGPGTLFLKGRFMGSGDASASGTFRPEKEGPDFTLRIAIKDTKIRSMNDLFRAYGNFDVSAGFFSFYSELTVARNKVDGYVKPLFRDIKVYDKRTDEERGRFQRLYEGIVGGLTELLEDRPREAVATKTPVTGTLGSPETSTWRALVNIVRNAFFQAILPGFEKNIGKVQK